jgi:soluble lytic murein transglycosylase-like protein
MLALSVVLVAAFSAATADARGVYRYIDDRGVIHFSNAPSDRRFEPVALRRNALNVNVRVRETGAPQHHGYDSLILEAARVHRVEASLVKAVVAAESAFDETAVSHAGAQGLMQLMPATARHLGVADPFAAHENIDGGARYLREMLDRYGDVSRALAAYNAGPEAVDRYNGIPPYRETRTYVRRVLDYYRRYRGQLHE